MKANANGKSCNKNTAQVCAPVFGEYNGKPTITLKRSDDDKYPFTFGLGKARLVIEHFDAIKKFVNDNKA